MPTRIDFDHVPHCERRVFGLWELIGLTIVLAGVLAAAAAVYAVWLVIGGER